MRKWLALLLCCFGCAPHSAQEAKTERWAVYYDKKLPAKAFKGYDLVVFDRLYYPDFKVLKGKTTVLGYVSIGEIHPDKPIKEMLEKEHAIIGHQKHIGTDVVDIGSKAWRDVVFAEIDDVMKKGFDGVMLDTVDSPIYYAQQKSAKLGDKAQRDAFFLIREIRLRYPHAKIMLNRGFDILPAVAPYLDYALAESTLVQTDVSSGQFKLFPPNTYYLSVSRLEEARNTAPQLKIYTLDYWNQDDVQGLRHIYAMQRARGYSPYVSTPDLRRHTPEPPVGGQHA